MNEINEQYEWMGYAELLAYQADPDYDEEWNICGSPSLFIFERDYETLQFPFTHQQYLHNEDVIGTIKAYGMDVERFWRAVQYIWFLNERKCVGVITAFPPIGEQLQQAVDYYHQHKGVQLVLQAKNKRKLTIADPHALQLVFDVITKLLQKYPQELQWAGVNLEQGKIVYSLSLQRCHVAKLFLKLFDLLELPDGTKLQVKAGVSSNKLLLISRLIYLMKLADTPSYLEDENALKANLRDYDEAKIRPFV